MAKHTPGPWKFDESWGAVMSEGDSSHLVTPPPNKAGRLICPMWTGCNLAEMSDEERETDHANARLIAAAPELLEALRMMAEGYAQYIEYAESMCAIGRGMSHPVVGNGVTHDAALRLARAAIAKAEGGAA